ncbi:manganese transporter pdt1, partial [Planoprotostelium fungivorum]
VDICFAIQLGKLSPPAGPVMRGFLPSKSLFSRDGAYAAVGILGATVMPHRITFSPVQGDHIFNKPSISPGSKMEIGAWPHSISAIRSSLPFAISELVFSLITLALFVNSAILIVAAHQFYGGNNDQDVSDLFVAYNMLSIQVGKAAGTLFAVALLFSSFSSSVVATLAGQIVSEGYLSWKVKPWLRRLITRLLAIVPSIAIVSTLGRAGIGSLLLASQAVLSILLPFAVFPLVYFTGNARIMNVKEGTEGNVTEGQFVSHMVVRVFGWLFASAILILNMYLIVELIIGLVHPN